MSTGILLGDPYKQRRSRWLARLLFVFGLLLAVAAAIGTYYWSVAARSAPAPETPMVDVLVAAREIGPRSALAANDLKVVRLPRDAAPANALRDASAVVGRVTTVGLAANEPVLPSKIAFAGREGVIAVLPPGAQPGGSTPRFRAMSINVPDANAAGGAIAVGDQIDILYTLNVQLVDPTKNDFVSRIVVEDVPVLAKSLTVYTLRVDVDTAERISALLASGGDLRLLLRAPGDDRAAGTTGASFSREAQRILR